MSTIKIPVLLGEKSVKGTQLATFVIKAKDLISGYKIDRFEPSKGEMGTEKAGYQRNAEPKRVEALANNLQNDRVDLSTAHIVNIRKPFDFEKNFSQIDENYGLLSIDLAKDPLYIVDSQHRTLAIAELVNDPEFTTKWKDKKIFGIAYIGGDFVEEKESFFYINNYAKSIPTGSKYELQISIEEVKEEVKDAVELTRMLRDNSSPWYEIIKYPNSKIGIIPNSSIISSLKVLYGQDWFNDLEALEDQFKILDAFWKGVAIILPDCFKDPSKYALQRAVGVSVMHAILSSLYIKMIMNNYDVHSPEDWSEYLAPLRNLKDKNRLEVPYTVEGADFWLRGSEGAAGKYSSGSGKQNLVNMLKGHLSA